MILVIKPIQGWPLSGPAIQILEMTIRAILTPPKDKELEQKKVQESKPEGEKPTTEGEKPTTEVFKEGSTEEATAEDK